MPGHKDLALFYRLGEYKGIAEITDVYIKQ